MRSARDWAMPDRIDNDIVVYLGRLFSSLSTLQA